MHLQKNNRAGFFRSFINAFHDVMGENKTPGVNYYVEHQKAAEPDDFELEQCENSELEAQSRFEIALAVHSEVISGSFVDMRLYCNKIIRLMKRPTLSQKTGRIVYRRIRLEDFTPSVAAQAKLSFTITDCIEFTRAELKAQMKQAAPSKETLVTASQAEPVKAHPAPSSPLVAAHIQEVKPARIQAVQASSPEVNQDQQPKAATGNVISAGDNTIHPKGRKPYQTFSVILQTPRGEVVFSGVELEKKFQNREFALGDLISIEKSTAEFVTEMGGERKVRTKNDFKIVVHKSSR